MAMIRNIAIAGLAAFMLGWLPAHAQEDTDLAGAPGYRAAEQEAAKRAEAQKKAAQQAAQKQAQAAADKLKADQAKLARQAEAQKAEQARLAQQAADLKAQQARLDARAVELAAEEKRLAQLRIDQESAQAAKLAELTRQSDVAVQEEAQRSERQRQTADLSSDANGVRPGGEPDRNTGDNDAADDASEDLPDATPETRRPIYARLDFENARRSCTRAGEDAALARNFYSARYDTAPRIYEDGGWELRGLMRLQDRRGYLVVDTVCEVDADGEVQRFALLR